jgi:3-isopropylmalate dehydrogenase
VFTNPFTVQLPTLLVKVRILISGIANPIGTILSVAMLFMFSFDLVPEATAIGQAVEHVLDVEKLRTRDLGGTCTTKEMGDAVCKVLREKLMQLD